MNIKKQYKQKTTLIRDIKRGQIFTTNETCYKSVYLKIEDFYSNNNKCYNAIDLTTGKLMDISAANCIIEDGELTIIQK